MVDYAMCGSMVSESCQPDRRDMEKDRTHILLVGDVAVEDGVADAFSAADLGTFELRPGTEVSSISVVSSFSCSSSS